MLQLIDVSAGYGDKEIIKDISLEVQPKEILAIIGINGSGKSTLLKTCLGLLHPNKGTILFDRKI